MPTSPETQPVDTRAFDLPGGGGAAALCLHGLTGTPYEVRSLGEALAARGVRAVGPALPGHNATPEELARVTQQQWRSAVAEHLGALRREHDRVFLVGLSMGGLLALDAAAAHPVDALVTVGVPLQFPRRLTWTVALLKGLHPFQTKRRGSDIRDAAARERHPSYGVMSLHAVHELIGLQQRVRAGLGRITAPIFVAHGAHDRTADPADARAIHAGVGSQVRRIAIFESSGHVVPVDIDGAELARAAAAFLLDFAEGDVGGHSPRSGS